MKPYFTGHAWAAVLFGVTLAAWLLRELRQSLRRRDEAPAQDRGSNVVLRASAAAGWLTAALTTSVRATELGGRAAVFVTGIAVVWAGVALRWWAFHSLGRYFTFRVAASADQPVVTDGPYRLLRHPSYTGLLLVFVGVGLTYGNLIGVAALALLPLAGFAYRIRVEEHLLEATLGEAYRSYAADRRRMIPFLW